LKQQPFNMNEADRDLESRYHGQTRVGKHQAGEKGYKMPLQTRRFVYATLCFMLNATLALGQGCQCGSLADLARGNPWYQSSSKSQKDLVVLLSDIDQGFDTFNRALSGSADADFITGTGSANFNSTYFEAHKRDITHRVEQKLRESYEGSIQIQYPQDLIGAIEHCNESCGRSSVSCEAVSVDPDSVEFIVDYHPAGDPQPNARFTSVTQPPPGAKPSATLAGKHMVSGANLFQVNRSGHPDPFTLTFFTSAGNCFATAPPSPRSEVKELPSSFNYSCKSSAGFNSRTPGGIAVATTCKNLPPGGTFTAVFEGVVKVDRVSSGSWVIMDLDSSAANPQNGKQTRVNQDSDIPFVIALRGNIPSADNPATGSRQGEVTVSLGLEHCQSGASDTTCHTEGDANIFIDAHP
jgi:hypothetical protein